MRMRFLTGMMLITALTISACDNESPTASPTLAFSDRVDNIDMAEREKLAEFRELYGRCLVLKSIQQSLDSETRSYLPNATKVSCAKFGRKYFEAIYADAFQIEGNVEFSKNTARKAVQNFEEIAFQQIAREHREALK